DVLAGELQLVKSGAGALECLHHLPANIVMQLGIIQFSLFQFRLRIVDPAEIEQPAGTDAPVEHHGIILVASGIAGNATAAAIDGAIKRLQTYRGDKGAV